MLGMLINAKKSQVRAPKKKVDATKQNISDMLSKVANVGIITIEDVQRVTGRLMSMMLAYAGVRVFTRGLNQAIAAALEENERRKRMNQRPVYSAQLSKDASLRGCIDRELETDFVGS